GCDQRFIALADEINRAMPAYVIDATGEALNTQHRCMNGARILVLGVAYKRGVGDIRESPALEILKRLRDKGADVSYADPRVPSVVLDGTPLKSIEPTAQALAAADCVMILTDHPEFDYRLLVELAPLVVDTRNATWGIPVSTGRVVAL